MDGSIARVSRALSPRVVFTRPLWLVLSHVISSYRQSFRQIILGDLNPRLFVRGVCRLANRPRPVAMPPEATFLPLRSFVRRCSLKCPQLGWRTTPAPFTAYLLNSPRTDSAPYRPGCFNGSRVSRPCTPRTLRSVSAIQGSKLAIFTDRGSGFEANRGFETHVV